MSKGIILHLCADTGSDSAIWGDEGYEVIRIGSDIGIENFSAEGMGDIYGVFANPPCTEFSQLARGGNVRDRNPEAGLDLVEECLRVIKEANPKFWALENPATGTLRQYLGSPDYQYQPWWFGSPWTKKTGLWGAFNRPVRAYGAWDEVPERIPQFWVRPGRAIPSLALQHFQQKRFVREFDRFEVSSDAEFRSLCSQKFARAFYEANKP